MTQATECTRLEDVHALADGELSGDAADAIRDHLATCSSCQAELAELLLLDAAVLDRRSVVAAQPRAGIGGEASAAAQCGGPPEVVVTGPASEPAQRGEPADRAPAPVVSLAWYRQRRLALAVTTVIVAAAAGVLLYLTVPRGRPAPDAVALAPHRVLEARLAWSGAAGYRAYDVPRDSAAPHEAIALTSIAALDEHGDAHGVGVLDLLNGELAAAAQYLARAGDSADVLCDRAALALAEHKPERAVALAGAALVKQAGHPAALWNLGLALRDLGRNREAAGAFREVARRGEPGWAEEAHRRAAALDGKP